MTAHPGPGPAPVDSGPRDAGRAGITLMTSALLRWSHRRGATAWCLARVRLFGDGLGPYANREFVVLSELRDNTRGLGITADVPGVVEAARRAVLPAGSSSGATTWLVHHGQFSTYDVAGVDTLTRISPRWDGHRYTDDVHDHQLLAPDHATRLLQILALVPVEQELQAWPTASAPGPQPSNPGTG